MRYCWNQPESALKEVEIFTPGSQAEAIIYAPEGLSAEILAEIPAKLRQHGFGVITDEEQGRPVLRVQKFGKQEHLLDVLKQENLIAGNPQTQTNERDTKEKKTFSDISVKLAGALYTAADLLVIASGVARKDSAEVVQGVIWGSTGVVLATCGHKDPDQQMSDLYLKLNQYLKNEGVTIPSTDQLNLEHLGGEKGILRKIHGFFCDHPVEFNNTLQAAGGLMMVKAGLNQKNNWKATAGAVVFAGQSGGMLVEEKPKEEVERDKNKDKGIIGGTIDWFKEKPLRITGMVIVNNFLNLYGALGKEKPELEKRLNAHADGFGNNNPFSLSGILSGTKESRAKLKTIKEQLKDETLTGAEIKKLGQLAKDLDYQRGMAANTLSSALYMAANLIYGASSKDTGVDLKSFGGLDKIYALMAHSASSLPVEEQLPFIDHIAGFLSSQAEVKQSAEAISQAITAKMTSIYHNPFEKKPAPQISQIADMGRVHQPYGMQLATS